MKLVCGQVYSFSRINSPHSFEKSMLLTWPRRCYSSRLLVHQSSNEIGKLLDEKNQKVEDFLRSRDWNVVTNYWREVMRKPLIELPSFLKGCSHDETITIDVDPRANTLTRYSDTLYTEGNNPQQKDTKDIWKCYSNGFGVTNVEKLAQSYLHGEFHSKHSKYQNKRNFTMRIGYDGTAYHGSQNNGPDYLTVERELSSILKQNVQSAGRTDRNVSAISQMIRFTSSNMNHNADYYLDLVRNSAASLEYKRLFAYECAQVPIRFHPRSSALWRRYIYLIPLKSTAEINSNNGDRQTEIDEVKINEVFSSLKHKTLPYFTFSRADDPRGSERSLQDRSHLYEARAIVFDLKTGETYPSLLSLKGKSDRNSLVIGIELVGSRFLRNMVRVLVSTALRECLEDGEFGREILVKYCQASDRYSSKSFLSNGILFPFTRNLSAGPAPGQGLCFAGVGYDDYDLSFHKFMTKQLYNTLLQQGAPNLTSSNRNR